MTTSAGRSAALVTGGAHRLGRALALALADRGYDIALHCHASRVAADETSALIRRAGAECEVLEADLAQHESAEPLIRSAHARFPALRVLVNNAARYDQVNLLDTSAVTFDAVIAVNLRAPLLLMQAFAKTVGAGDIVNIVDNKIAFNQHAYGAYLLAKRALADLTRLAALELAPAIKVNAIAPGVVLPSDARSAEVPEMARRRDPDRSPGQPLGRRVGTDVFAGQPVRHGPGARCRWRRVRRADRASRRKRAEPDVKLITHPHTRALLRAPIPILLALGCIYPILSAAQQRTPARARPEPAGWFAGDAHVHRGMLCARDDAKTMLSPAELLSMMEPNDLDVISVLGDIGNGEIRNAADDLPLITGKDHEVSTPSRLVHWDAEWHFDPKGVTYEQKAIGGHLVALGLESGHQIYDETTHPIIDWVQAQGGVVGFAHMQYLKAGIPEELDCCLPLEYPVEVALTPRVFLMEDVRGSDTAIDAYYRLLNSGFRPGLAAGTDYPCYERGPVALGDLLTMVHIPDGQLTYRKWIDGIAAGRTVVSRNGHNEFIDLKVNREAGPGDEIRLAAAGSVEVEVTWTSRSLGRREHRSGPGRRGGSQSARKGVARFAGAPEDVAEGHSQRVDLRQENGPRRSPDSHGRGVRHGGWSAGAGQRRRCGVFHSLHRQPAREDGRGRRVGRVLPDPTGSGARKVP